jgi:TolB protein
MMSASVKVVILAASVALMSGACSSTHLCDGCAAWKPGPDSVDRALPGEAHLSEVHQITFGGENAEAYWSFDDRFLIFQSTRDDLGCDQIFTLELATGELTQLTDTGRTTCAFFLPDSERLLFASTHATSPDCPPVPDRSKGYAWPLYDGYEIYTAERDGTGLVNITNSRGYDAEATVSRDGRIVFTSDRSGDLELWTMDSDGGNLKQLTDTPGYDGGAFFSRDGTRLVWRASRFDDPAEEREYFRLLGEGIVRPSELEIFAADADGTNVQRLTGNGSANFGPFFTPDGASVVFSSNMGDPGGRIFEIWKVDVDGSNLEQITFNGESFDGFPMFSWCGARLAFSSNRNSGAPHDTNVFIADWNP